MPKTEADSKGFATARVVVKIVAIALGLISTLLCLMAAIGSFVQNGWVRSLGAIVVAVVVPAVLTDRLLPDDDPAKARGLPGDIFALIWLGFPLVFAVVLGGATRGALTREGDRLSVAGYPTLAKGAYLLGGVNTRELGAAATPGSASASSSASAATKSSAAQVVPDEAPDAEAPSKPNPPGDKDRSPADLFKELAPAVVTVWFKMGTSEGGGTGFLIDDKGTIVTNYHVIATPGEISIRFMNGAEFKKDIELLAEDSAVDLALLHVNLKKPDEGDPPKVTPVVLGDSEQVVVGERAISIGNPLGLEHTLTDGLVSARRVYEGRQWIQMSVPVSPGNSGGPLFNMKGTVIGITTAQLGQGMFGGRAQNLNLAVPVDVLKKMVKPSYPGRHKFGQGTRSSHW